MKAKLTDGRIVELQPDDCNLSGNSTTASK